MDRSLVKRTIALIFITIIGVCILLPTFLPRGALPSFLTDTPVLKWVFSSRMSWGLDLQGGLHLVYSIDLDKAVDDRASELKRDIESSLVEGGIKGSVRTPSQPLGAVTINLTDATKLDEVKKTLESTYGDTITMLDCPKTEAAGSICMRVSSSYADGIKKAALTNAVLTIRERINEKGVAEPNVVEKGDD